jgi:transposase
MCDDLEVDFRLIDPRQMPEIAKSKKKTDQNDVEAMVRRFHVEGGLPEAFAANRTQREFRGLTRTLSTLRGRNRVLLNRIHAEIDSHGLPSKKTEFCKAAWREKMQATLSPDSWLILEADLKQVDLLVTIRVDLQKRATELAGQIRNYARLLTIPGVGPVLASIILAETPHILSFKSARTFAAYCGLVPAVRSSAGKARCGRITKSGPRDLRWALGHAVLVGQFPSASLMYKRKKAQKKPWKAALCAGANKLARVVWSMLVHGTDYQVQVEKV